MRYIILGGGAVTAEFYLPAFVLMGRLGDVTVVDPFESSLAPMREAFGEATFIAADYADFLASLPAGGDERIIITLPNRFHVDGVTRALEAGRHVLCEKPLALEADACRTLQTLASDKSRVLKVAMSRRYLASMMLARQIVAGQELGAVKSIEVRDCVPFLWKPKSFEFFSPEGGGVLADMGVHYLDYLDTLVGPMTPLTYEDDAHGGIESSLRYQLKAGKADIAIRLSRIAHSGAYIKINCERGQIRIDKTDETGVEVTPLGGKPRRILVEQPFDNAAWPTGFNGSFCQMLADFERAIAGEETPIADVADAVRATGLIEWAYAHRAGGPARRVPADEPKILVTGATGFIGGHLVERLSANGEAVRVTVRSPTSCANVARFPVQMTTANILDPASARAAVSGMKTVYHLAYGKESDAPKITINGTRNIVEAAIAEGVESVVVLSTMYVFGFPAGGGRVDESAPYNPYGGEYGASKAAMEQWVLERAKTSGKTRIVVVNPTCVFGPQGGAYTTLPVNLASEGRYCWMDGGIGSANYTYVENTVDALLLAAHTPAAHGERFILNDGVSTWRDFLGPFVDATGKPVPSYTPQQLEGLPRFGPPFHLRDLAQAIISSPKVRQVVKRSALGRRFFDRANQKAAGRGETQHFFSYRQEAAAAEPVFAPEWLADLYSKAQGDFSSDKAQRVLGWTPKVSLAEAQAKTLAWLRDTGHLPDDQKL